jgi:hypothetical protein
VIVPSVEELLKPRANISTPRRLNKLVEMLLVFSESIPALLGGFEKIEDFPDKFDFHPKARLKAQARIVFRDSCA